MSEKPTPDEMKAWRARYESRMSELVGRVKRIEAELEGRPAPNTPAKWTREDEAAWNAGREARTRGLELRIERAKAELAAKQNAS